MTHSSDGNHFSSSMYMCGRSFRRNTCQLCIQSTRCCRLQAKPPVRLTGAPVLLSLLRPGEAAHPVAPVFSMAQHLHVAEYVCGGGGARKTPHLPSCGWCTEQPEMIISNLGPDLEVPDAVVFKLQPTETYRIFGLCLGWSTKGGCKAGLSIRADLSRPTSMSCSCVCHSPMGAITL